MYSNFENKYKHIWKGYQTLAETAFVMRSGFQLVGIAEMTDPDESVSEKFWRRDESTLEHSAKVAYLCGSMMSHFPSFFDGMKAWSTTEEPLSDPWTVLMTALLHDIGEVATGDIPDDGNTMHGSKDSLERALFISTMTGAFERRDYQALYTSYSDFQDKIRFPGQAIYALDKLEAVLNLLTLERYGVLGSIATKPTPTEQDLQYSALTGTNCATDGWAAHMKSSLSNVPKAITNHVFGLLRVATIDVRGKWFPWWEQL